MMRDRGQGCCDDGDVDGGDEECGVQDGEDADDAEMTSLDVAVFDREGGAGRHGEGSYWGQELGLREGKKKRGV